LSIPRGRPSGPARLRLGPGSLAVHRQRHADRGEELFAADGDVHGFVDGLCLRLQRCRRDGRFLVLRFRLGGLGLVLRLCLGLDGFYGSIFCQPTEQEYVRNLGSNWTQKELGYGAYEEPGYGVYEDDLLDW